MRALCDYHGLPGSEALLARLLDTTSADGTPPEALRDLALELGLAVEERRRATLEDLACALEHGAPCLCPVQMHGGGHWVVVRNVSDTNVEVMDPVDGLVTIPREQWERIWWDTAHGVRYDRYALAVGPPAAVQESRLHRALREGVQTPAPEDALDFFRGLVPTLGADPGRKLPDLKRRAMTLAVATDTDLIARLQQLILDKLASGDVSTGAKGVQQVLADAGVTGQDGYAATVFRTNTMDALTQGIADQIAALADTFPVWQYSNPNDSRSRPAHAERNGRYYPASVPFAQVRGTDISDVANCRCVPIPVSKWDWARLKRQGARIADGYPDVPAFDDPTATGVRQ
jgi:hypothetical protein